jgi:hypothetical protein
MKKGMMILAGAGLIAMSAFSDVALSLSEDPQWTPYVLNWDRELSRSGSKAKKVVAKKEDSIQLCTSKADKTLKLQR